MLNSAVSSFGGTSDHDERTNDHDRHGHAGFHNLRAEQTFIPGFSPASTNARKMNSRATIGGGALPGRSPSTNKRVSSARKSSLPRGSTSGRSSQAQKYIPSSFSDGAQKGITVDVSSASGDTVEKIKISGASNKSGKGTGSESIESTRGADTELPNAVNAGDDDSTDSEVDEDSLDKDRRKKLVASMSIEEKAKTIPLKHQKSFHRLYGEPEQDPDTSITFDHVAKMLYEYKHNLQQRRNNTIHPAESFMRFWDIIILISLIYTATITPFEVAFLATSINVMFFFNRLVDLVFVVDIAVNFKLAYKDEEQDVWVYTRWKIFKRYASSWFLIDFVSVLPFDVLSLYLGGGSNNLEQLSLVRLLKLFRLIKLMRIFRASRIFQRWETKLNVSYAQLSLYKFAIATALIIHWGACLWALTPTLGDIENEGWIQHYGFADSDIGTQYLASVYWSTMTATTIGYGDIGPQTNGEKCVAILIMLIGAMVYALIVGSICGIINSMDEASTKYRQTLDNLNRYLEEERAPHELRMRLRRYFMHCRDMHRNHYRMNVLKMMSPGLLREFTSHTNKEWMDKINFVRLCPAEEKATLLMRVATKLRAETFPPNESIIEAGMPCDKMYIVKSGLAACLGKIFAKGKAFGEDVILQFGVRDYQVNTLTYVNVMVLFRYDLVRILMSGDFTGTRNLIRRLGIRLALRRAFVQIAKEKLAARRGSSRRNSISNWNLQKAQEQLNFVEDQPPPHDDHNGITTPMRSPMQLTPAANRRLSVVSPRVIGYSPRATPDTPTTSAPPVGASGSEHPPHKIPYTRTRTNHSDTSHLTTSSGLQNNFNRHNFTSYPSHAKDHSASHNRHTNINMAGSLGPHSLHSPHSQSNKHRRRASAGSIGHRKPGTGNKANGGTPGFPPPPSNYIVLNSTTNIHSGMNSDARDGDARENVMSMCCRIDSKLNNVIDRTSQIESKQTAYEANIVDLKDKIGQVLKHIEILSTSDRRASVTSSTDSAGIVHIPSSSSPAGADDIAEL